MLEVAVWLLVLFVLSVLTLPISSKIGVNYVSKAVGLVLLSYTVWLFANFLDFRLASLLGFVLYSTVCAILILRWRTGLKGLRDIARFEMIFLLSFALYILYTAFNPAIFGGEKMMDVGVLSGILRSRGMPPIDVNLAGFRFDCYYYMGYLIVATLTSLSGARIGVAYNLGLATFFALTISISVEFAIRRNAKLLPLLLLAGNLVSFFILLACGLQRLGLIHFNGLNVGKAFDFWVVTRVIPGTINEFPFATLTFRDLHPHLMDIPFQILFIALLYEYFRGERRVLWFLTFLLGFMFTVNSWEFPTYATLLTLAILITRRFGDLIAVPISLVPFIPYVISLHPYAVKGIGLVSERTPIHLFLVAQPLMAIPLAWLAFKHRFRFLAIALLSLPIAVIARFQLLPILLPVLLTSVYHLREKDITNVLLFVSALTLLLVEIFYVNDPYPQKYERLNTVFKTYIQAWIMLSFASAFILSKLRDRRAILTAVIFLSILWIYPIGFLANLHYVGTIDGMAYTKAYGDYNALRFLQTVPNGVIVEYPGKSPFSSYTYAGRVSAFTGLQSVIARGGHELFWRYYNNSTIPMLYERWRDVNEIYEAKNLGDVIPLLRKYDVRYIYVGSLERAHYDSSSLSKFRAFEIVYHDPNVTVYEVTFLTAKTNDQRR